VSVVTADITISGKLFHTFTILGDIYYLLILGYMTSSYTILLLFQVQIHSTRPIIFISQDLVYLNHITSIRLYLRVGNFNLLSLSL